MSDCTQAISELRANPATNCSTQYVKSAPSGYSSEVFTALPLVSVGNCQVLLDPIPEQTLSCSQVADYASNLAIACSNNQMGTGGRVYPLPQGPSVYRTGIVLSRVKS